MNVSMDKETQKIMREGENWKLFIEGEMWKNARAMLQDSIVAVESIHTLKGDDIANQIEARKLATNIVNEWVSEIEGLAAQYEVNKELKQPKDDIITHH